jgi:hypothetical protein
MLQHSTHQGVDGAEGLHILAAVCAGRQVSLETLLLVSGKVTAKICLEF